MFGGEDTRASKVDLKAMAEEEKEVEVKAESPESREENSKHRRRSRSPINAPGRRGGRGSGRGPNGRGSVRGKRYGGYRGWDRTGDEVDNKTNSEEPHLKRARLFVGNLKTDTVTRGDLAQLFSQYGRVLGVSIHSGFAFVQMDRERDSNRAIICEDGQLFKGSKIRKFLYLPKFHTFVCPCVYTTLYSCVCANLLDVEFSQAAKDAGSRRGTVFFVQKMCASLLGLLHLHL